MKFGELKTRLKKGDLSQLYLLAGEENYYIQKAEEAILKTLFPQGHNVEDVQIVDGSLSINDLIGLVETVPFFSPKNVIIVRDAVMFKAKSKGTDEDAASGTAKKTSSVEDRLFKLFANMPEYSIVIFELRGKPDGRKKIYKEFAKHAHIMEAEPIKSYNIDEWLQEKLQAMHKTMDSEAHAYFVRAVGMMENVPLGFLDKEMEKLSLFMGAEQKQINRETLVQVFSDMPEIYGFAMNDAISNHDIKKALYLFNKQQEQGVYIVLIIGQLVHFVRQMWQAKTMLQKGLRDRALGQAIGVSHPFIIKKITRECQGFSEGTLKDAFLRLAEADFGAKTGQLDSAEVEAVIISLCANEK
ncbi:DNA polymerase III, delta subunit [Anaerovibrio sp. JC8]|uniref:DNA polymerase III subunit delta n=1 Tax=Anaerovibrio sp. JC8 TaxID=1240085 RepID=UPI000A09AD23|nr:DNA polymerase III subunit delta [Anaerovibrio sp. JC8]ORU01505.1 DNA polymerase III, delta subunit [Anaerovibrio sp. JC8]